MIVRTNTQCERAFPLPLEIVEGSSAWFAAAESPFRWLSRPSLPGLLWLHRAALVSEIQGCWSRAEFYWREFDAHFAKFVKKSGSLGAAVVAVARKIRSPAPEDAELAGGRFVDEVLIDTHAAVYNSLIEASEADAKLRSIYHLNRLKARLPDSGMTASERASVLRPVVRAAAQNAEETASWSYAAKQYRGLLEVDPSDQEAQDGIVRALWQEALHVLGTESSEASAGREAKALEPIVSEMESLTDRLRYHADLYDILARIHLIHAVRLANSSQLAEALVSVEKALAARPEWDEAEAARKQLKEMMEALQKQVRALEIQIQAAPNATLNESGVRLQSQARTGFGPAQRFAASDRAKQLSMFSERARARRFWLRLGLAEPVGDWDAQAKLLMNVLGYILTEELKTPEEIKVHWNSVIASEQALADLDQEKVLRFLEHRLLGGAWQPSETAPPAAENSGAAPLTVALASRVRTSGGVPFGDWLHSGQDRGLKTRIVLAAMAVLLAGGLVVREQMLQARRERAFSAVAEAARQQNHTGVMQAAADFLTARPFTAHSREPDVVSAYQRAFVHWIAGLHGDFQPEHQPTINRYLQLTRERKRL